MKPPTLGTQPAIESRPSAGGDEETPAALARPASARLSNPWRADLPRFQQGSEPGGAESGQGSPAAPGGPHKKKGPARHAGGQGKQPPDLPPTDQRPGNPGDLFPEGMDPHEALDETMRAMWNAGLGRQALPWLDRLAEQIQAIDQLGVREISGVLTRLAAQMESLREETAPALAKRFEFLDRSTLADKRIQYVLDALERHIANHPPFDEDQFDSLATWLANAYLLRYSGAALCCLAMMEHIDPSRNVPSAHVLQPFLGWCLDVLRHQPSDEVAEKFGSELAPHLRALCRDCTDQEIEEMLWYRGLPALQHQRPHSGSRDLLRALVPYVERFFAKADFAGFDVLDALRGLKNLHVAADDPLTNELALILTRINAAVTARALGSWYSERLSDPRFADNERWIRPNHENVLANLIDDLSHHFPLEAARELVSSVYDWLAIDRQRFSLDPARLTDRGYRDALITGLRTAKPEAP